MPVAQADDVVAKFGRPARWTSSAAATTRTAPAASRSRSGSTRCRPRPAVGFESITKASQLEVSDKSTTWNISTSKLLLSNDFVIARRQLDHRVDGRLGYHRRAGLPGRPGRHRRQRDQPSPGTQVQWVGAYAHPVATLCDGPSLCDGPTSKVLVRGRRRSRNECASERYARLACTSRSSTSSRSASGRRALTPSVRCAPRSSSRCASTPMACCRR